MSEAALNALFAQVGEAVITTAIAGVLDRAPALSDDEAARIALGLLAAVAVAMGGAIGMSRAATLESIAAAAALAAEDIFGATA